MRMSVLQHSYFIEEKIIQYRTVQNFVTPSYAVYY